MSIKPYFSFLIVPFAGLSLFFLTNASQAKEVKAVTSKLNPPELGLVKWERSYEVALKKAKQSDKPVFILFQEVPGCSNCTRFGNDVLSHPLIVDAIQNEFIPLCIYNNKDGEDGKVLKKFNEPAWNNPVVRIIDASENELTVRMGDFHPKEIITGIVSSLKKNKKKIPEYVSLANKQITAAFSPNETIYFAMYCFWAGEVKLGSVDGVTETTSGFMKGHEVVEVKFNPALVSAETLIKKASQFECTDKCYTINAKQKETAVKIVGSSNVEDATTFKADNEVKYYLSKTAYKYVPMMPLQKILVNIALYKGQDPQQYLGPSQVALYNKFKSDNSGKKDLIQSDNLVKDWITLSDKLQ